MNYPVGDLKFSTRTSSFIEDWLETGYNNREIHHKNGWKRKTVDQSWLPFTSTYFDKVDPDPRTANYSQNYDGGAVNNEYFFMSSGGNISPVTNTFRSMLYLPIAGLNPGYPTGVHNSWTFDNDNNEVNFNWEINTTQSPQFSYHMKVYNSEDFDAAPIMEIDSIKPHARTHKMDISNLAYGKYYIKFFITDIFDNVSTSEIKPFTKGELVSTQSKTENTITISPNPFNHAITIKTEQEIQNGMAILKDINGRVILEQNITNTNIINFSPNINTGIYFITIKSELMEKTYKVIKK